MASRVMHLAIATQIEKVLNLEKSSRFQVGQVLPDAVISADKREVNTHFIENICNGSRKMFNFNAYYSIRKDKVLTDHLYLGYYFHLIQDSIFRRTLYYDLNLLSKRGNEEFQNQLYQDYHILNGYLVDRYNIDKSLAIPVGFGDEEINNIYPFEISQFLLDMQSDLNEKTNGETKYFTEKIADNYIEKCVLLCIDQYKGLLSGKVLFEPKDFSWELQKQ